MRKSENYNGVGVLVKDNGAVGVNILTKVYCSMGDVRCSLDKTCFRDGI